MADPIIPRELIQFFNDSREIQRYFSDLGQKTDNYLSKIPTAGEGNLPIFDEDGGIEDSGVSINQLSGIGIITTDTTLTPEDGTIFVDTDLSDITITLVGEDGEQHRIVNIGSSGNLCTLTSINNINGFADDEPLYDSENLDLKFETIEGWF